MCFGGSVPSAPAAPALVAPPPPQAAVLPSATAVRSAVGQAGALKFGSTLLTGGLGDPLAGDTLGVKTLLGL
jgi:hypothetical protein